MDHDLRNGSSVASILSVQSDDSSVCSPATSTGEADCYLLTRTASRNHLLQIGG